jgi:hypothetical protein
MLSNAASLVCFLVGWIGSGSLMCRPALLPAQSEQGSVAKPTESGLKPRNRADDVIPVDCKATIERRVSATAKYRVVAEIDLGALVAMQKYRVNITLLNPYDTPIEFSAIDLSCGCGKFEAKSKEIRPLSSAEFTLHLDVPNHVTDGASRATARFVPVGSDPEPALLLSISYGVNGAFGFEREREIVELPKSEKIVVAKVPIVVVPPLTIDKLTLESTDGLRDMTIQLVADDPDSLVPYVKIEAPRQAVPRYGLTGEVLLKRIGTDRVVGLIISFKHQEDFSIRPESLRLSRDNHSKPFEATTFLRVYASEEKKLELEEKAEQRVTEPKEGGKKVSTATPQVGLTVGGVPARVEMKRMGHSGIYRLTIRHDGPLEADSDGNVELRWQVILNGEERVIESHAFLSDR